MTLTKKKFSWRALISFSLTYIFVILLITGLILYISPPGRYANWVNWKIAGLTKEGWQALHTVFSFTFVILSVFHLFTINWKTFLSYLRSKTKNGLNKKREFIISTMMVLVFTSGIIFSIPPFKNIMDLGEYLTESWEKQTDEPPVPHAELLTLNELADQLKLTSVKEITEKLKNHQVIWHNTQTQTLAEIATLNKTTPMEVYQLITRKPSNGQQGQGVGRKTLEDFSTELNIPVDEIIRILKENNIHSEKNQTLKQIGELNNMAPRDIYALFEK